VALAPNPAEGYEALGSYYRMIERDHGRAREEYAKGLELAPGNSDLLGGIGRSGEGISNIRGKIVLPVKDIQRWLQAEGCRRGLIAPRMLLLRTGRTSPLPD
jgi:hypothetical protein